jgi:threonine dehydrogenase-like Zn-dependent dehydrogenase
MRAAVFQGVGQPLSIETITDPTPGPGQVVIRVGRCGICGSDLHLAQGPILFECGAVPGHEYAGEVVALGSGVTALKSGDRVAVMPFLSCGECRHCLNNDPASCVTMRMAGSQVQGGYADYVLADAAWCVKLPQSLGFDDGALVEPLAVSLRAVRTSPMTAGDRVLVIGAGPIGVAAAYWARRSGAGRIAVSATSLRREAIARALGADAFITPEEGRTLADQSREALGGAPDIVIECAGVPGSLDAAVGAVRRRGHIASPGFCWTPDTVNPMLMMIKEATIRFTNVYDLREFEIAVDALDAGHVEPRAMITGTVGLDETPAVFDGLLGRNPHCKVQIAP